MNSIRILLVDDNPSARALLAAFVEQTPGLELCGEAGDGWQGLELTDRLRPDLVLLDLIMPGLDGIGFLEGLANLSGSRRPRVIVLSGVSTDAYVQHSCRLGADYYLVKPVNFRQLAQRISALFPEGEGLEPGGSAGFLLLRLGADSRLEGYGQLSYALEMVSGGGRSMQMKEIYLSTAEAFHTTAACVEKNLRTVIRGMHAGASPHYVRVFGPAAGRRPPDNRTFLRRAAEELAEKER
ncbi:response regulator [uncultured Pseudoflavonifractor sp.]|uniref:response regulator n=1 Tax=uncultured Pseudoflavonifractor sp. TaxID=1221379 RepID=UPI0025FDE046|nr:response regulator [uncultured Pseudoflavonifractor sp.]